MNPLGALDLAEQKLVIFFTSPFSLHLGIMSKIGAASPNRHEIIIITPRAHAQQGVCAARGKRLDVVSIYLYLCTNLQKKNSSFFSILQNTFRRPFQQGRSKQGTRGPGTRDRGPGTKDRGPRTEDRGPGTEDRGPGTGTWDLGLDPVLIWELGVPHSSAWEAVGPT